MLVSHQPTFPNNSALKRGIRVKMTGSGGYLVAAGATEDELGTIVESVLASDTLAAIVPIGNGGVKQMVANGVVNPMEVVYAAAAGKVSATPGTLRRGIALTASSGDNSIINVLPQAGSGQPV